MNKNITVVSICFWTNSNKIVATNVAKVQGDLRFDKTVDEKIDSPMVGLKPIFVGPYGAQIMGWAVLLLWAYWAQPLFSMKMGYKPSDAPDIFLKFYFKGKMTAQDNF